MPASSHTVFTKICIVACPRLALSGDPRDPRLHCRGISIFACSEDVLRPIVGHRFCGGGKRARCDLYAPPPRTISAITSACKATRRLNRAIPTRSRNAKAGAIWKPCRRMQRACVRLQRRRARSPRPHARGRGGSGHSSRPRACALCPRRARCAERKAADAARGGEQDAVQYNMQLSEPANRRMRVDTRALLRDRGARNRGKQRQCLDGVSEAAAGPARWDAARGGGALAGGVGAAGAADSGGL